MIKKIGKFFVWISLAGCATGKFKNEVSYFGDVDIDRGREVAEKAKQLPWERKYPVQVFKGALPEGLSLAEGGSKLVIAPGYEKKYEVLGIVSSNFDLDGPVRSVYWYPELHEQHSRGRHYYCAVQAPLRLLTLGIWSLLPPSWPCFVAHPDKESGMKLHVQELKRSAFAMGADIVILSSSKDFKGATVTTYAHGGVVVSNFNVESVGISGFAVKSIK